jgi:hypothetical protein
VRIVRSESQAQWTADDAMLAYVDWRTASDAVRSAYRTWAAAPRKDAALAHGAYEAALDREAAAAQLYAQLVAAQLEQGASQAPAA